MTIPGDDLSDDLIELERAQIGHEIHDALLPLIFAASAGITSAIDHLPAGSDQSREKLIQASKWVSDALVTGRQMLTEIYPPELIGSLWVRTAKDAVKRLIDDPDVRIDWKTDSEAEETSQRVALAAYRIVVESIRNAIRHGKATEVQIDANRNADMIEVVVRDNGTGFDPTRVPTERYGIRAMHGRAKLVGGQLSVDSKPGGPTTVVFRVTLQLKDE